MKLAGSRFDPKGDRLSPTAMEHLKQSFEACEAAAAAMLELGNLAGFAEAKLYLANGKRVAGERNKSASQIRDAIAAAEEAKDKLAAIDLPDLKAQTVLAKEGALSEPGAIERKPICCARPSNCSSPPSPFIRARILPCSGPTRRCSLPRP